jgi:hypothetical protein
VTSTTADGLLQQQQSWVRDAQHRVAPTARVSCLLLPSPLLLYLAGNRHTALRRLAVATSQCTWIEC